MPTTTPVINPWLIACLSKELKRNRPLGLMADKRPIVLLRNSAGNALAFEDRCAHRNAPLSNGCVKQGRLQCRYHGWSYLEDGTLAEIPTLAPGQDMLVPAIRIARYHTIEQDGFIWITFDQEFPASPPLEFPHFKQSGWTSFVMKTRFAASMTNCLENFLDCPHATYLHKYWFRAPTAQAVRATVRSLPDGAQAEFSQEPREKSLVWWLLAPRRGSMRHTDRFIAPRTSQVDYVFPNGLHYMITSSCTPLSDTQTEVYTVITFRSRWLGWLVKLFFKPLARRIIAQDVQMLNAQQKNIERFGGAHFTSTPADLLGRSIVAWQKAIKTQSSPPESGQCQDVEIRL